MTNATSLSRPLWIDAPDAMDRVDAASVSDEVKSTTRDLITNGFSVIPGAQDPAMCQQVIEDYHRYCAENRAYVDENLDTLGREKRLVNFHLYSEAAMRIGNSQRIMDILDFVFGSEAGVYTSLTFKYGTQQPVHRDTPHFATWPDGYFAGVWTALEDISPEAGPLFYYEGAHRFPVDVARIWRDVQQNRPDLSEQQAFDLALDLYNGRIIDESPRNGELRKASMRRGDVAIWHPQLPHGGSPASDPMRSRWSIVCHCAPVNKQVHQHASFFRNAGREEPPARYGFTEFNGRKVAAAGGVAFM
ncbi:MAG: phytanoyl-CoA dioxygenase family protein [Hyphomonas sp.]|uniref:phytanoyl-CoA dioxygenase family protein n=1 Tax=Hyphomonas sp. TaxID=87 RepID=UPI003527C652